MSTEATSAALALQRIGAVPAESETALSPAERRRSSLLGLAIGAALFSLAAIAALLYTAAVFGYPGGLA